MSLMSRKSHLQDLGMCVFGFPFVDPVSRRLHPFFVSYITFSIMECTKRTDLLLFLINNAYGFSNQFHSLLAYFCRFKPQKTHSLRSITTLSGLGHAIKTLQSQREGSDRRDENHEYPAQSYQDEDRHCR